MRARLQSVHRFDVLGSGRRELDSWRAAASKGHAGVNVFELRDRLVADYGDFTRSFVQVHDERVRTLVDSELDAGLLGPEPLIQLNPTFEQGGTIEELVDEGLLDARCRAIFRRNEDTLPAGEVLRLHRHQTEAIRTARSGDNYILTTGTGSGKSLAYMIPVVDEILRGGPGRGIQGDRRLPDERPRQQPAKRAREVPLGGLPRP